MLTDFFEDCNDKRIFVESQIYRDADVQLGSTCPEYTSTGAQKSDTCKSPQNKRKLQPEIFISHSLLSWNRSRSYLFQSALQSSKLDLERTMTRQVTI